MTSIYTIHVICIVSQSREEVERYRDVVSILTDTTKVRKYGLFTTDCTYLFDLFPDPHIGAIHERICSGT